MAKKTTSKEDAATQVESEPVTVAETTETTTVTATDDVTVTPETTAEATTIVNTEATEILQQTETIVVFKVNRPLMDHEYEELEKRIRQENEKSGLKIVLAPYSVDVEITGG